MRFDERGPIEIWRFAEKWPEKPKRQLSELGWKRIMAAMKAIVEGRTKNQTNDGDCTAEGQVTTSLTGARRRNKMQCLLPVDWTNRANVTAPQMLVV